MTIKPKFKRSKLLDNETQLGKKSIYDFFLRCLCGCIDRLSI